MSTTGVAKSAAAEALYKAITAAVEGMRMPNTTTLEQLAHAYALVAGAHREPGREPRSAVVG